MGVRRNVQLLRMDCAILTVIVPLTKTSSNRTVTAMRDTQEVHARKVHHQMAHLMEDTLQKRLVTALVVIAVLLVAVIGFMVYKVIGLRKEQAQKSTVQFAQRTSLMSSHSSSNF